MVQKTETDYETVEKTIEVTYCDVCGMDYDEEEIAQVAINPDTERARARRMAYHGDGILSPFDRGFDTTAHPDGSARMVNGIKLSEDSDKAYVELQKLRYEVRQLQGEVSNASPVNLHTDGMFDVCRGCLETSLGVETIPTQETNFQVVEREPWTKSRVRDGAKWLFGSSFGKTAEPQAMLVLTIFALSWAFVFAAMVVGAPFVLLLVPLILGCASMVSLVGYIMETVL